MKPFPGILSKQFVEKHFITKSGREVITRVSTMVLTDEQREWLCRWFPEVENTRLMKASGMSHSTLHRFARELGLAKSEKGLHGIMKRQAKLCKKICEQNGYYDSLRGKPVSDACRKGTARMWQEIREGKREHPFSVMKRKSPRKYRKLVEGMRDSRKELIRKERWRHELGLVRHTRIHVPLQKYTRRQVNHRYHALKRGYFVMNDCREESGERWNIYFDEETERSDIFEKNLVDDGFKVIRWCEKRGGAAV